MNMENLSCRASIPRKRIMGPRSESTLQNELPNIRTILINNGYSEVIINTAITRKTNQFRSLNFKDPNGGKKDST